MLSKQQILDADDLAFAVVSVPEWGGEVRIRTLSVRERDEFEATISTGGKKPNLANVRARLVMRVIVDADGKQVFDLPDVALLGRKSAKAMERVFEAARKLNGFSKEDIEELAKNSEETQPGS